MLRDLRIDFLRGLVLLLIVADHVLNNESRWFSVGEWVYCDCAAAFVFMSGLVCGMVYSKALMREGWLAAQTKAASRVIQLYFAQMLMLAAICALFVFAGWSDARHAEPFQLATMFDHPRESIPRALTLQYSPWLMDVLKLYIVLLLALPCMLWLYQRSRLLTAMLSFGLYALAQKYPEITPYEYPHHLRWFWNPIGWQFLFFGAAALGCERARGTLRIPRNAALTALAVVGLIAVIALRRAEILPWMWTDRQKLAPMHIIGFGLCAYLISGMLRPDWTFWQSRWAKPVLRCGRHSLPVFCTGAMVSYGMSMLLLPMHNPMAEAVLITCGVGLTLLAGTLIDKAKWPSRVAVTSNRMATSVGSSGGPEQPAPALPIENPALPLVAS